MYFVLKVIVGRLLAKNCTQFKWLDSILPKHIPHQFSDMMAQKSEVVPSKLMLYNEAK